jgi:hypothetical protein
VGTPRWRKQQLDSHSQCTGGEDIIICTICQRAISSNNSPTYFWDNMKQPAVCFTILVLPVLLDEEYWSFQYRVFYNTSITSIVGWKILELPVLCIDQRFWYSSIVNNNSLDHMMLTAGKLVFPELYYFQYGSYQYFIIQNTGDTSIANITSFFLIKTNGWKDPIKYVFLCE